MLVFCLFVILLTGTRTAAVLNSRGIDHMAVVAGQSADLSCDVSTQSGDALLIILWHRNNSLVYSYDLRSVSESERSWINSTAFSGAVRLRLESDTATLHLSSVQYRDRGLYRCRVDYRYSRTTYSSVTLSVIVPPQLTVTSGAGSVPLHAGSAGKYSVGDQLTLTCTASHGLPRPTVWWTSRGSRVNSSDVTDSVNNQVSTTLHVSYLSRAHLHSDFRCLASNNNVTSPITKTINVDLKFGPLSVSIVEKRSPLVAGSWYQLRCQCVGSRPAPSISWYLNQLQISQTVSTLSLESGNMTESRLNFTARQEDDNKSVYCRCENPHVNGATLEDVWRLSVHYKPEVFVRLAASLDPDRIKQGDDVYFECSVTANPPVHSKHWLHNGAVLEQDIPGGIIISNSSLVLQRLNRSMSGRYACSAANSISETTSSPVLLNVKYAPVCVDGLPRVYGAAKREQIEVLCRVSANPEQVQFRWTFNNSAASSTLPAAQATSSGTTSVLSYTPLWQRDYGTLICWTNNQIGMSHTPCVFHVLAAGVPDPLTNCSLEVDDVSSVTMRCEHGFDGGVNQSFHLDVTSTSDAQVLYSRTVRAPAVWRVAGLQSTHRYTLRAYSQNAKGQSAAVVLLHGDFNTSTTKTTTKQDLSEITMAEIQPEPVDFSPLLAIVLGICGSLVLLTVTAAFVVRSFCVRRTRRRRHCQQLQPVLPDTNADKCQEIAASTDYYMDVYQLESGTVPRTSRSYCNVSRTSRPYCAVPDSSGSTVQSSLRHVLPRSRQVDGGSGDCPVHSDIYRQLCETQHLRPIPDGTKERDRCSQALGTL